MKIKILLADDHAIVRKGLRELIGEHSDLVCIGDVATGEDLLRALPKLKPDLVIMDISMPGRSGLEVLGDLRAVYPKLPVIILSMHPEEHFAVRAIRAGASGYLNKEVIPDELIRAVRKVFKGGTYISEKTAVTLAAEVAKHAAARMPHELLSDREFQILRLIASGKTVSVIASALSLSVKTISTYRTRMLKKMNMKNNSELTRYALEHHLLE